MSLVEDKIKRLNLSGIRKFSLLESYRNSSPEEFVVILLGQIETLESMLKDTEERLQYAEMNRTHPRDVLAVGDSGITMTDLDVKISDDSFRAGLNFKF